MTLRVALGPSSFAEKDPEPRLVLERAGVELVINPHKRRLNEAEIIELLASGVDGLIAGLEPLNRRVLASAAPRLRAVARVGIGVTNVDFEAARELGIKVSSTPEPPAQAVAELTITALLALVRNLVPMNQGLHAGGWSKSIGTGLIGLNVLLIGYGRIGRRVGAMLRPFGARLMVCDPFIDPATLTEDELLVGLNEGLAAADAVSLHAAGTSCLLGRAELARMRPGAWLLNSARGELVDETALVEALQSGHLAGAWFDAFWQEPYTGPLLGLEQVLLTPHAATYTKQCRRAMETEAAINLLRDLNANA